MKLYINHELCQQCGGACCKRYPGATFPQDIVNNYGEDIETALVAALRSGFTIDWWEGDLGEGYPKGWHIDYETDIEHDAEPGYHQAYYIRPRCDTDHDGLYNGTWGGQCVFLTDEGCKLAAELRPTGCRLLEPQEDNSECVAHGGGKLESCKAWWGYCDVIKRAADIVEGRID